MIKLVVLAACCYALFVAFVYLTQQRMLYFPNQPGRALTASPQDIGLAYEDVSFTAEDGVRLHGWWIPGPGASDTPGPRAVLFLHGNAGNISHRLESIRQFHALGLDVLIIDYRGYGQSDGRPSEPGTYRDAHAAWRYLTAARAVPGHEIVIFGRSLGGSIAAWLAAELAPESRSSRPTPAALIVESAFSSAPELGRELYPYLPVKWLSRFSYATRAYVATVRCPVLVVHSRGDEIVPFRHGVAIHAAAPPPAVLLELEGPHNGANILFETRYLEGLAGFLATLAPRAPGVLGER